MNKPYYIAILFILLGNSPSVSPAVAIPEDQLKAAFIEKIIHFVEWPSISDENVINICVFNHNAMASYLHEIGRESKHNINIVYISQAEEIDFWNKCEIIYLSQISRSKLNNVLARIKGLPILTVSDATGFAALGSMINFIRIDDRLAFEINKMAADSSGLKISSRLLKLAIITPYKRGRNEQP